MISSSIELAPPATVETAHSARDRRPVRLVERSEEGRPTLTGHFAVFNTPTEINSLYEGHFIERFAPGAFKKTLRENKGLRVLFQHGHDPELGDKPIADLLRAFEDERGARYEATLFDGLPQLVVDGLRAGAYGASFRFRSLHERLEQDPGSSEHNPAGLPERTVLEASVAEFGPVTFPAYEGADASLRSSQGAALVTRKPRVLRGENMVRPVRQLTRLEGSLDPARDRLAIDHPLVQAQPRDFCPAWSGDLPAQHALKRQRGGRRAAAPAGRQLPRRPDRRQLP